MRMFGRLRTFVIGIMGLETISLEIFMKIFIKTNFILLYRPKK